VLIIAVNAADTYGKIDLESVGTRLGAQPSYILFSTREQPERMVEPEVTESSTEVPVEVVEVDVEESSAIAAISEAMPKDTIEVVWTADNLFLALPPQTGIILT
jgi:cyclomaltodextrinase / maltogenic alpha-amylase / neopullulanase